MAGAIKAAAIACCFNDFEFCPVADLAGLVELKEIDGRISYLGKNKMKAALKILGFIALYLNLYFFVPKIIKLMSYGLGHLQDVIFSTLLCFLTSAPIVAALFLKDSRTIRNIFIACVGMLIFTLGPYFYLVFIKGVSW